MRLFILVLVASIVAAIANAGMSGGFIAHPYKAYTTIPAGDPGAGVHEIQGIPLVRSIDVWLDYVYIPSEDRFEPYAAFRILGQYDGSPFNGQVDDGHTFTLIAQQEK